MAIIQQPDALSMSGNMKKFIVSSGSQIVFELKEGITTLLSATYEPGVDGRATIDVKDIIENRLSYTLSHNNFYEQTEIVKTFTAIIDGSSHTFKVIRAGIANLADTVTNWLRGNFLTWQPTNKQITYYSPEWITYYAQEACTVKLKATFPDAEQTLITLGSCVAGKAFTFNLQYAIVSGLLGQKYPTHYDVWVENLTGTRLTYIQRYLYTEQKSDLEQWFLFENSLGGLDTIRTSGDTDFTGEYDHKLSSTDNISKEYLVDTKRVYNQNTGYLDDYERRWLLDFFPAIQKYIYHVSAIRRIVVSDSDVKYSAAALPSSYNFSYHFTEENEAALLNLIRNQQDIPSSITIPNLDSPDFHLPPRLSEYPRVPLHEGVILPAFDPNSDTPKITTLGAIIAKSIEELLENIPGSDGTPGSGGQMVNIVREDDVSSGDDNTVYSSLRTLKEIQKTLQNISDTLDHRYLSKIDYDTAQKIITFIEGIEVGDFSSGPFGSGAAIKNIDGVTVAEVDQLKVRMRAEFLSVLIHNAKHIGGELIVSAADMICIKVEEFSSFYRCYFDRGENNEVNNLFTNLDRARCQVFTGSKQKFYWRKILAVGNDYIELSKTDMAPGDNDIPEVGDFIYQLGSDDPDRQGAMIFSTVGVDAPSFKQYGGLNGYSLGIDKLINAQTSKGNLFSGKSVFRGDGTNYDDWSTGIESDVQDAQSAASAADAKAQQAIEDAAASVTDYNAKFAEMQAQVDGEISNYSYPYTPTLLNYPASDWATDIEKDRHIGDVFHNSQAFVDNETTPDSGKAWRFVKNGTAYSWTPIADSDAVKAIQEASKAQAMADGKSTTFLITPSNYKLGDMWVLNADQTVNGTAYKSGEILTATQDSTTFVQAHWVKRVRYTDDTKANQALSSLTNFTDTVFPQEKNQLQSQIDGKIETHFTATDPATAWTTADLKTKHTGDMWFNSTTKKLNRYSGSAWVLIEDQKAIDAFNTASTAKDTADGKRRVFTATPTVPYDVGDLWAQGTSGDLMRCATAKTSAQTYNVADWVKASKYTDDTAVNNLEIGSRNYFSIKEAKLVQNVGGYKTVTIQLLPNTQYIVSTNIPEISPTSFNIFADKNPISRSSATNGFAINKPKLITTDSTGKIDVSALASFIDSIISGTYFCQIEKGNKVTDWKESPEDVQDKIDSAKQEALTAAGNAQTSANTAQTTANALKDFTDTAFSDGVVDRAEAKSIEKYKNTLNETMAQAEASYTKVFLNPYLESGATKTALENAKINLWGKRDTLLNAINTAITGGIATPVQKTAVDTAFNNFNTDITAFKNALEEANKAIQMKLEWFTANSQVGGSIISGNISQWTLGAGWTRSGETLSNLTPSTFNHCSSPNFNLLAGKTYILSFEVDEIVGVGRIQVVTNTTNTTIRALTVEQGKYALLITPTISELSHIRVYGNTSTKYIIKDIKLNEAITDRVEKVKLTAEQAQLAADGYMRARYVRDWIKGNSVNADNHWREIKIFNKSGVNIAQGKSIKGRRLASSGFPYTNIVDNDISTYGQAQTPTPTDADWVEIDLGQVYYDIDFIQVWHPFSDGRTYFGTKTEISEDGINWTTIFDSAIEGTYKETAEGKIHTQRYASVMAKLVETSAKTKGFTRIGSVDFDSGLIFSNLMKLFDIEGSGYETAFISGITGAANNLPAFGAGSREENKGVYEQALSGKAGIIFRHDGTGKIGVFEVDKGGSVKIYDLDDPTLLRLEFIKSKIPTVASLNAATSKGNSVTNAPVNRVATGSTVLPNTINVTEDGAELSFIGNLSLVANQATYGVVGSANAVIRLYRNGVSYTVLGNIGSGSLRDDNPNFSGSQNVNIKLTVPKGIYSIALEANFNSSTGTASITNTSTLAWLLSIDIRKFVFGSNGFTWWDKFIHFLVSEDEGVDGRAPADKWNVPGVLLSATVALAGGFSNWWGAKKHASNTAVKVASTSGTYDIYHNIGHTNYQVSLTPHSNRTFYVGVKDIDKVRVYFYTNAATPVLSDTNFDVQITGNNY